MSGPEESQVHGYCIGCAGDHKLGRLINEVDTNSGAGWTNVICPDCEERGWSLPHVGPWTPRAYSL
ncbi:hypothetical protein ABH931_001953 [Streptacidiphilus sp. MAP12-33]|uniref:hypothetical protein n=1 Tax=Streptacidiphilus sp. MAP12-33 TaxID=3156266 RepID=UPI0035195E98